MNSPGRMPRGSSPRIAVLALVLAALFVVVGSGGNARPRPTPASPEQLPETGPVVAQPQNPDATHRALAVGTWQDEYQGKRTMHLRADGTGTMIVELSGLTATLFADRLEFDMVWSIEGGRMQKRTLGGRPEGKVKAILAMMGDRVDEPILELSDERLLLLDADGKTRYDWRRAD
ncbi:MAG: hypothetical protein ACYC6Y_08695 [Thermoguttaceae bacterium]